MVFDILVAPESFGCTREPATQPVHWFLSTPPVNLTVTPCQALVVFINTASVIIFFLFHPIVSTVLAKREVK